MKNLVISRIEPTNPMILTYVEKINDWDQSGTVQVVKDDKVVPFYALFYNAKFAGAGTIEFDKEASKAKVALVNGSLCHSHEIQDVAISKFEELVTKTYGPEEIEFSYIKKRGY